MSTKTYALMSDNTYLRDIELRETKNYLIDDVSGERYRKKEKGDNNSKLAFLNSGSRWYRTHYSIFEVDAPEVLASKEKSRKESETFRVSKVLEELVYEVRHDHAKAMEVCKALGLGICKE